MVSSNSSDKAGSMPSLKTLVILGAFVFVFAGDGISALMHTLNNRTVTATIVNRDQTCRVLIRANKKRTRKTLPCEDAYALKKADENGRTQVYRRTYVTLYYMLNNGRQHSARVREKKVGTWGKPIGSKVEVAYSKRNPNRLSKPRLSGDITKNMFFAGGVALFVLLLYWLGYRKLKTILERAKKSIETAAKEAQSRQRNADDILARIEEDFAAATAPNPVPAGPSAKKPPTSDAPARTPRRPRRKAKPAPIPTTGGVVSKRRRGWFG